MLGLIDGMLKSITTSKSNQFENTYTQGVSECILYGVANKSEIYEGILFTIFVNRSTRLHTSSLAYSPKRLWVHTQNFIFNNCLIQITL